MTAPTPADLAAEAKQLADALGDIRVMASRGRATREEVNEAARELHAVIDRLAATREPPAPAVSNSVIRAEFMKATGSMRSPMNGTSPELITFVRAVLAYQAVATQRQPIVPEGMALVPIEPTEAMLRAGLNADAFGRDDIHSFDDPQAVYRAMLAAAPVASEGDSTGPVVGEPGSPAWVKAQLATMPEPYPSAQPAEAPKDNVQLGWGALKRAWREFQPAEPKERKPRPLNGRCAANLDGDCSHPDCPQLRDGEPKKSGRSCPLWQDPEEH